MIGISQSGSRDFILPQIEQAMTAAMGAYSMQNAMNLGGQAGTLLANAPTTVLSPMNYTVDNVRPFNVEVYVVGVSPRVGQSLIIPIEPPLSILLV
jgi:hypothetical protein